MSQELNLVVGTTEEVTVLELVGGFDEYPPEPTSPKLEFDVEGGEIVVSSDYEIVVVGPSVGLSVANHDEFIGREFNLVIKPFNGVTVLDIDALNPLTSEPVSEDELLIVSILCTSYGVVILNQVNVELVSDEEEENEEPEEESGGDSSDPESGSDPEDGEDDEEPEEEE